MKGLLYHFVYAGEHLPCAFFEGDEKAIEISRKISPTQRRKFVKKGIVPSYFYVWMKEVRIILKETKIPIGGTTIGELLNFLRFYPYVTDQARSTGEYIFRQIIRERTGLPDSAFGLGDYVLDPFKRH